jgi:hypothetical protein
VKVQHIAALAAEPNFSVGADDAGESTSFDIVDGSAKDAITEELGGSFAPTFVRHSVARKALSNTSRYPKLGIGTTLPQHRLDEDTRPRQLEYPVPYFFYGTLAEPERLQQLLGLEEEPRLEEASVLGGALIEWAGKYKTLVDAEGDARVDGWAYVVRSKEEEDGLRYYETDKYEVVRCTTGTADGECRGLTFRVLGECD